MATAENCVQLFTELGLTELEAQIYLFLLQDSPATGYKIAKGIGRSFPSTYKGLASLEAKGAILVDEGNSRMSRAVSPDEFVDQLESRFREKRRLAVAAVSELPKSPRDTRIYQLTSVDQVYERCRRMIGECEQRALVEMFPDPLNVLRAPIEDAAARGVMIAARVYKSETLAGVHVVQSPFGSVTTDSFKSDWLAIFVDGRQFLLANLLNDGEGVLNAVWSANSAVSRTLYDHANSDFHHYAFRSALYGMNSIDELRTEYERLGDCFPPGGDLGFTDMIELAGSAQPGESIGKTPR